MLIGGLHPASFTLHPAGAPAGCPADGYFRRVRCTFVLVMLVNSLFSTQTTYLFAEYGPKKRLPLK